MKILYFLEDSAQELFITALVNRVAKEESISPHLLCHDTRSALGTYQKIDDFEMFLRDTIKTGPSEHDLIIVAWDGNCKGRNDKVRQLEKLIKPNHPFKGKVLYAVPDPHIERWYLMDQKAFKEGVGVGKAPDLPPHKCKKDYYKKELKKAFKDSNIQPQLGGTEYAEKIVDSMEDLYALGDKNAGFRDFVEDLRGMFKRIKER